MPSPVAEQTGLEPIRQLPPTNGLAIRCSPIMLTVPYWACAMDGTSRAAHGRSSPANYGPRIQAFVAEGAGFEPARPHR